jgi:hypothetical protein
VSTTATQDPDGAWRSAVATTNGFICETSAVVTADRVFVVDYTSRTWELSAAACAARGGHLATLATVHEQLLTEPLPPRVWIGASDPTAVGSGSRASGSSSRRGG